MALPDVAVTTSGGVARVLRAAAVPLVVIVVVAVIIAVLVSLVADVSTVDAARAFYRGSFGSKFDFSTTLARGIPIAFVALGASLALRAGVFNVGGEGQMAIGALAGYVLLVLLQDFPALLAWPVALVGGIAGGAAWALIPAWLAVYRGTSEILSTLLMNFVGLGIVTWAVLTSWLKDPGAVTPQSKLIERDFEFAIVWSDTRLHAGIYILAVTTAAAAWFVGTRRGFMNELQGANPRLAQLAGVRVQRAFVQLLLVSGAAAGLAGIVQVLGATQRLTPGITGGVGFTGLLVAVLGRSRPIPSVIAAFAFAALITSGEELEAAGVARPLVLVVQALIVIAAAVLQRTR